MEVNGKEDGQLILAELVGPVAQEAKERTQELCEFFHVIGRARAIAKAPSRPLEENIYVIDYGLLRKFKLVKGIDIQRRSCHFSIN